MNDLTFDHTALVQNVMDQIDDDQVKRFAVHGENAIANAQPVEPMMAER